MQKKCSEEALKNITGYITFKKRKQCPELSGKGLFPAADAHGWMLFLIEELTKPSEAWLD